jgi:hypothetical protein
MDTGTFLEEFKRLTIENEQLKHEIKQIRISKNNEIDEVEALYTKTSTELKELKEKYNKLSSEQKIDKLYSLTEYKGLELTKELIKIIEFKQTKEFTELKKDWDKMIVPLFNVRYGGISDGSLDSYREHSKYVNVFIKKYQYILNKFNIQYDVVSDYKYFDTRTEKLTYHLLGFIVE